MPNAFCDLIELRLGCAGLEGTLALPATIRPLPGQYLFAFAAGQSEALAVPLFPAGPAGDLLRVAPPLPASWAAGMRLQVRGPLGSGFRLPPGARRVALAPLGCDPERLLPLAYLPLAQDAAVALFSAAIPDGLPSAVEIAPPEQLPDVLAWADYLALDLAHPLSVEATSAGLDGEITPPGALYTYRFGPRGDQPPVKLMWYDGGLRPPTPDGIDPEDPKQRLGEGGNGILFVGDKGWITCAGWAGMPRLLPLSLHASYKRPAPSIPRSKGHHADWLTACKGGPAASGSFEYSARLTEIVLLGNVALRARKAIRWDGANMKATNAPESDALIKETYRQGWAIG